MNIRHNRNTCIHLLIYGLCCIAGCVDREKSNEDIDSIKNILSTDTSMLKKEKIFKQWLSDTLVILDTSVSAQKREEELVSKDVTIRPDSLGLTIDLHYNLIVGSGKSTKEESDPEKLLSLLNEYDEYPKPSSRLKFTVNYFYSPSPVPELPYDIYERLDNIEIIELNDKIVSEYGYIRGSLSGKTVTRTDEDGTKRKESIDFIWQGNKLIKRKLE